jgi:hypothetical protein
MLMMLREDMQHRPVLYHRRHDCIITVAWHGGYEQRQSPSYDTH